MDHEQGRALLQFVRSLAEAELRGQKTPAPPDFARDHPYGGAFVTMKSGDQLRGCMGRLKATGPLPDALADITRSTLADPRFTQDPITASELDALTIELSILSGLRRVDDPSTLVAGRHGVVVSRGGRSGCLLPQVATERGWSIETLLTECCRHKAGLPGDAWCEPGTEVEAFEVELISEDAT